MRADNGIISVVFTALYVFTHATVLPAQTSSMRVTVPSPTAASLGRFGDVPVSLYTGVPDISIPLFTVEGRTLALPITLRYNASGIRVEEIGGWAGLGWALEAGGVITRTVRGLVDESASGYFNTGKVFYNDTIWQNPTQTTIDNIANELLDGEPDRFFFSFGGRSGQFVMGPTTSTGVKEFRATPYQDLRIVPTFGGGMSVNGITRWEITAEDGTRYTFAAVDTTTDYTTTTSIPTGNGDLPTHYGESHASSWHLTEIRSPGGDVINLFYSSYHVRQRQGGYREKFDNKVTGGGGTCVPDEFYTTNEYEIAVQRLDSITSAAYTVKFAAALRSDALAPQTNQQQEYRLDRITVATPSGTELRRFQFEHDYFPGNRLRLKAVYEQDRNGVSLPPYTFTYDGQTLPSRTSYAQDHWGFYNGVSSNTTPIPELVSPFGAHLSGANRKPDSTYMKAGVLTRITYPTGGYNEFVYEANDYGTIAPSTIPIDEGPLHQASISSQGGVGFQSTQFTIGGTQSVTVTIDVLVQGPSVCGEESPDCPMGEIVGKEKYLESGTDVMQLAPGTYTLRASDGFVNDGTSAMIRVEWRESGGVEKKLAGGLRVAEIRTADAMGNLATRRYKYTLQSDPTRSSGIISAEPRYDYVYSSSLCGYYSRSSISKIPLGDGPIVGYREVTVWHGANAEDGMTRYAFRSVADAADQLPQPTNWPFAPRTSYEWKRGQQTGITEYNALGQVQRRTGSKYLFREAPADSAKRFRAMSINSFSAGQFGSVYRYDRFEIISAWAHPDADTTFIYNESGTSPFSTVKTYNYGNPAHLQVTQITETNSDGKQRITRMKYPGDYASGSGDLVAIALTAMKGSAHMHNQVIERWVIERIGTSEAVVQAELTTFKQYNLGQYLPYQRFILNSPSPIR